VSREAMHKLPLVLSSRLVGERGQLCLEKQCTNCFCSVQPGWSNKEAKLCREKHPKVPLVPSRQKVCCLESAVG
jgi:hypothetical protein